MRFAVVFVLVLVDLWSKHAVFAWLRDAPLDVLVRTGVLERDPHGHWRHPVFGQWFALMTSENPGMAFGQLGEWPRLLVIGRALAVLFLSIALWRARRANALVLWGLVLVLSGAIGNLWDNLFRERVGGRPFGMVRDFLDVYFAVWDWHFPTFNFADTCITLGAVCFLLHGLLARDDDKEDGPGKRGERDTADPALAAAGARKAGGAPDPTERR